MPLYKNIFRIKVAFFRKNDYYCILKKKNKFYQPNSSYVKKISQDIKKNNNDKLSLDQLTNVHYGNKANPTNKQRSHR